MKDISAETLGGLLFGIHSHHPNNEKIIYYEDDIIALLQLLGHPKPVWGEVHDLKTFKLPDQ